VNHIALNVESMPHLLQVKKRLESAGVNVIGVTDHHIIDSIYFFDPSGFRLELTVSKVTPEEMTSHASEAHTKLQAWTDKKLARMVRASRPCVF
jgi:catechol-2,3-dioxygenase